MDAVFLHRPAVELVEVFARGADVDVEYVHLGVRVLLPAEHGVLGGVHAADFGAVGLAPGVVAPGAHALDKDDGVGMFPVGGPQQGAAGGASGVHQPLKFQRGHYVGTLGVGELVVLVQLDGLKAGSHYDCAIVLFHVGILLFVVDSPGGADLGADAALAAFQHGAVGGVNGGDFGHRLGEGDVDGPAVV